MAKGEDTILIVEDDQNLRTALKKRLSLEHKILEASSAEEARKRLKLKPDLVILDLGLPNEDATPISDTEVGFRLLDKIRDIDPTAQVIVITGAARDMEYAVRALKKGAFDYILKDKMNEDPERLSNSIRNALRMRELLLTIQHQAGISEKMAPFLPRMEFGLDGGEVKDGIRYHLGSMVGDSTPMQAVYNMIKIAASSDASVLITGENGTGKELVAQAIHDHSKRAKGPFVAIDCAAISEKLLESELFGHVKGAFTDAIRDKKGKFELANAGTIFLDEIGEVSPSLQAKLLRSLQEREIERVGDTKKTKIDIRVIAATNKDLENALSTGEFRQDLYYRLNKIPIEMPSLSERRDDIPELARHILISRGVNGGIEEKAVRYLQGYDWPGNVRQLENVVERASLFMGEERGNRITLEEIKNALSLERTITPGSDLSTDISGTDIQNQTFFKIFADKRGNIEATAKSLNVSHATAHNHFKELREEIFSSLCKHQGSIEALSEDWGVSVQNLQEALGKKKRILRFVEELRKNGKQDEEAVIRRFTSNPQAFRRALDRLREISS